MKIDPAFDALQALLVGACRGSVSAEHGIGIMKRIPGAFAQWAGDRRDAAAEEFARFPSTSSTRAVSSNVQLAWGRTDELLLEAGRDLFHAELGWPPNGR